MDALHEMSEKEMKLICLFHNGNETVIDLLSYIQSNYTIVSDVNENIQMLKTSMLATYPRYIAQYPREFEKIVKELSVLIPFVTKELYDSIIQVLNLSHYIATTAKDTFWYGKMNWKECWNSYCPYIVNILTFLNNNNVIDDRKYFQRCLEVEVIIFEESMEQLYKVYDQLYTNHHFGETENIPVREFSRRFECRYEFFIQFDVKELEAKSIKTYQHWFGSKRRFAFRDIHLFSDMTDKVHTCAQNVFDDKLGDINSKRYILNLCGVNMEYITVKGLRANETGALYEVKIKPAFTVDIPECYRSYRSDETMSYWDAFGRAMKDTVKKMMCIDVDVGLNKWQFDSSVIDLNISYSKKSYSNWKLDELYKLGEAMSIVREKLDKDNHDLSVFSIYPFFHVRTYKLNYRFQIHCFSYGLKSYLEQLIPITQATLLDIGDF